MLEATGPITAPGWDGPITTDNVVDVLGTQLPSLPSERSNAIQASIGQAVWNAIQNGDLSPSAFATALSRSVKERHMQLWFADPAQEALADGLGATGRETLGKNPHRGGVAGPGREQGRDLHRAHDRRGRHPRRRRAPPPSPPRCT